VSFVHGHARTAGWVVAHVHRPNLPEAGQLPLLPAKPLTADVPVREQSAVECGGSVPAGLLAGLASVTVGVAAVAASTDG
jgi:hypothetical protein